MRAEALPKAVARAFAESTNLEPFVALGEPINTKVVERAFKAYLAEEITESRRSVVLSPESLCDVTDRGTEGLDGNSGSDKMIQILE